MTTMLIFWIGGSIAVGMWAERRGRSAASWMLCALLFSPLLSALFLAVSGNLGPKCVHCAETVKPEATLCKHCGRPIERALAITPQLSEPRPFSGNTGAGPWQPASWLGSKAAFEAVGERRRQAEAEARAIQAERRY